MVGQGKDREYQRACVAEAIHNNVIVVLPTGSGKTRIALRVIQDAMRKLAALGTPNQAPDETAHTSSDKPQRQQLQAASEGENAAPGPSNASLEDLETGETPKRRLAAVFLAPTVALCMQQADVLKVAGLRVALMCAGVAETLNPDATKSDSEEDEESSDEGQGEQGSQTSLVKHSRQHNFSAAEARAIAAEIGEWNGDGEEWELDAWREQFKIAARARKEKNKKGGEVDVKASGTLLKGRLGPSSARCWAALLSGAYDVLVATPAELLQGLVHASIRVSDVAVWVLDEVHHASGNHPYAILMSSFVHNTPKHLRPHIVGLTATPLQLLTRKDAPPDASTFMKQQAFLPANGNAVGSPPLLTNGQCSNGSVALVPSQAANGSVGGVGPGGHVRMGRYGTRAAVGVSEPCALEQLLDAHIISAPDSGVVSSIVPAVIERCVSYPVSAMPHSLESALKVVAEAQNTLRQVARHRQLRSLLMTQESLAEVAQQQLHEQTNHEGMDGVIEASPRNMYHTLASQLDAALFCGRELGLWACLASLKHGLLSAVDSRVSDLSMDTDCTEEVAQQQRDKGENELLKGLEDAEQEERVLGSSGDVLFGKSSSKEGMDGPLLTTDGKLKGNQALQARNNERRQIENELRRLLGSMRCSTLEGGRAELESAAARYALSDALLSLAEVAAPDNEDLAYQIAVDIDDAFDTHGLASTLLDGHLAEPVAGRLLSIMPVEYIQELLLPEVEDLDMSTEMISAAIRSSGAMSTWAAHLGTHAGHAATAAATAAAAASSSSNPNAAIHVAARQLDESCGWFSSKIKAIVPLLLRGQCLGQAVGPGKDPSAAVGDGGGKGCVWGGSAMVFVKRKATSLVLHELISLLPEAQAAGVRSSPFIGDTGFASSAVPNAMSVKVQRATMAKFRQGHLNLLLATHVGAEGLDFGCCGLVVLLDPPTNVVDYLQCRGRGRISDAICVQLLEEGNIQGLRHIDRLKEEAQRMQQAVHARNIAYYLHSSWARKNARVALESGLSISVPQEENGRPGDCPRPWGAQAADEAQMMQFEAGWTPQVACAPGLSHLTPEKPLDKLEYVVESTMARCPAVFAPNVLERYCAHLPGNAGYLQLRPRYMLRSLPGGIFQAALFMPSNSPVLAVLGKPRKGKGAAQSCSALEAIHRLHQIGALNDNLHPASMPLYLGNKKDIALKQLLQNPGQNAARLPPNVVLAAHIMNRDMVGIVPRIDLVHALPAVLKPKQGIMHKQRLREQRQKRPCGPEQQRAVDQLRLHALAGGRGAMDVDLAVEQALDADADMEMDEGEAEAGQGAAAEEDDNGQIDPLGHVKGGRGAALYHAPLLHRIRDGMARLREIRMAEEMSMCANTAGGAGVTPSADASGRAGVGVASVGGSGTVVQHWGGKKGAGMEADQPQQQAQPGQEHDHAHEVGQSQQQLEQLCAELDAAATEQQQGPDDQKHEQQQQQQQQQPHSATTGTTNPRTQQPTQAAGPQSSERVMHLYGFVIQRTPQPSHDLMGPLGVPIYDATSMWEHAQGDAHCAPPRVAPPPCPWPQPPAGTPSDLGAAEQEDVLAAVRAAAATAMAVDSTGQQQQQQQQQQQVSAPFTNGNAEEVEPGWRFHGSCAGPAFGHARASWLHPFGLLLHQLLPPAALPPFSIWMRGGRHALVAVVHLGEVRLSQAEAAAALVGHKVLAGIATRPPPSPEQLALPPPPNNSPLLVPPWSMKDAIIGWNIKAGLHHLHDAMHAAGLAPPREPWPHVDNIYIHSGQPPTVVPPLEEAPGLVDAHWYITVPVTQGPCSRGISQHRPTNIGPASPEWGAHPLAAVRGHINWSMYQRLARGAVPVMELIDLAAHAIPYDQVPPPAPSPIWAPISPPPAPAPFLHELEHMLRGCVVIPAYSTSQRYIFMGSGRVRSVEEAIAEQEAEQAQKTAAEGAKGVGAGAQSAGAGANAAKGGAGGTGALVVPPGGTCSAGAANNVAGGSAVGTAVGNSNGSSKGGGGLWQVTLDDPVLMPGSGLTLEPPMAEGQQVQEQQQGAEGAGDRAAKVQGSQAETTRCIPHPTYRQLFQWRCDSMPLHCVPRGSPLIIAERGTGRLVRTFVLLPPRTASEVAKQERAQQGQVCPVSGILGVVGLAKKRKAEEELARVEPGKAIRVPWTQAAQSCGQPSTASTHASATSAAGASVGGAGQQGADLPIGSGPCKGADTAPPGSSQWVPVAVPTSASGAKRQAIEASALPGAQAAPVPKVAPPVDRLGSEGKLQEAQEAQVPDFSPPPQQHQQQQQQRQGGVRQVRQFAPPPAPDPVAEALAATAAAATAEQVTSAAEVKKEAAKKQEGGDGQKEDQEEEEELEPLPNRANIRVPPVLVPPQWAGPSAGAIAGTLGRPPRMELLLPSTLLVHPLHMDLWQAQHMMPSLLWRLEGMVCAHELRERLRSTLVHGSAAGKGLKRNDEGSVGNDSAAACAKQESTQESEEQQQQQLQQPQAEEKGKGVDSQDVLQAALPPLRDVLAALTAASSNEGYCCEGVELVGDTVLGYLAAVHLFNTLRSSHEGVLSECKVRLVANEVLLEVTTGASSRRGSSRKLARAIAAGKAGHPHQERLMMQRYIRANTLDVTHFWGKGALVGDKKRIIKSARGKRVADSVEALLGATFLASGGGLALGCIGTSQAQLQPAQQAASRNVTPSEPLLPVQQQQQQQPLSQHNLQVPWATTCSLCSWDAAHLTRALASTALLSERMTIMPPFSSRELKRLLTGESHNAARQENEKALEQPSNLSPDVQPARLTLQERQDRQLIAAMAPLLGGYEFRDAALLREALTHCSCPHPPCNQRLEFLGDAAIEMLAVCHLLANPQSRICPPDQGSASLPPATTGLLLRDPEDPKDEGPAPPLPVPPLDPGVLHISRSTLIANRTLALMCAKSGLWRHMRAGLRHVTRLAASYVAGVSRPISCCKEDVATVAAKAAVASHGNARYTAMETELPCASAKPQQLLDNGTNEDAAKSCNDKENRDGNKEDEGEDAPKLLADLVEAVLGGVLIDCDGGGGRGLVAAWNAYCGLARAAGMDRDLRLVVD